jgi:hypothetical protein
MKVIINCVISWNYLNRELFEPYGLRPDDRRPKAISYEDQANVKDLNALGQRKVDLVYFHEGGSISDLESQALSQIYSPADKVFTIIHEPILKSWEGITLLNQLIEKKPYFPVIPTHSTHGPFIDLMYKMGESFQNRRKTEYDAHFSQLSTLAGSQPARNRQNAHLNAALDIMNRTLQPTGPSRVLWMADNYQDLFLREQVKKPGVRVVLEEMDRQYDLQASVSSLRVELHRLLFVVNQ